MNRYAALCPGKPVPRQTRDGHVPGRLRARDLHQVGILLAQEALALLEGHLLRRLDPVLVPVICQRNIPLSYFKGLRYRYLIVHMPPLLFHPFSERSAARLSQKNSFLVFLSSASSCTHTAGGRICAACPPPHLLSSTPHFPASKSDKRATPRRACSTAPWRVSFSYVENFAFHMSSMTLSDRKPCCQLGTRRQSWRSQK